MILLTRATNARDPTVVPDVTDVNLLRNDRRASVSRVGDAAASSDRPEPDDMEGGIYGQKDLCK